MQRTEGARLLEQWLVATATSAASLAATVGVSRVTVHHWLHGRIRPRGAQVPAEPAQPTSMRELVATATNGAVRPEAWDLPLCDGGSPAINDGDGATA